MTENLSDTALLVCISYFRSIMSCGMLLWGGAVEINSIFILQKSTVRLMFHLRAKDSLRDVFKETGILTVFLSL